MPISEMRFRALSRPACLAVALALALSACGGAQQIDVDEVAVKVAGQRVVLAAPSGFCFDNRSTDINSNGAFLLAADCALTAPDSAASAPVAAFVTVSVSNSGLPEGLDALEAFLRTDTGTSTLGKSTDPDAVTLLDAQQSDDVLLVKVRDTGEQPVPGASGTFWRAFFQTAERLVGLSVVSFRGAGLSDAETRKQLLAFAERTRGANPPPAPEPVVAELPEVPAPQPEG